MNTLLVGYWLRASAAKPTVGPIASVRCSNRKGRRTLRTARIWGNHFGDRHWNLNLALCIVFVSMFTCRFSHRGTKRKTTDSPSSIRKRGLQFRETKMFCVLSSSIFYKQSAERVNWSFESWKLLHKYTGITPGNAERSKSKIGVFSLLPEKLTVRKVSSSVWTMNASSGQ